MQLLMEYLPQWLISNLIVVLILVVAIRKPKLARALFFIMFALACWVNYTMARNDPDGYLHYAYITPFSAYANFINGWFKEHITAMVTLISIGQGLIAIGMALKGWLVRLAGIGAVIFFICITPLGIGSGFPFTIIASVAIYFILKKDDLDYLWKAISKK